MSDSSAPLLPVLEIGGTHLATAVVDGATWTVVEGSVSRRSFDATGTADELVAAMADAASSLASRHGDHWAVAIPGPFDYEAGIGRFEHVAKFDSLRGVDVRERLLAAIQPTPASVRFLNDADAFGVGEFASGAARGADRAVCITLGTGVGSAFLDRGVPVNSGPTVPPEGSAHLIRYRGRPLEDVISRRAIRLAYCAAAGVPVDDAPDVHEIAEWSRSGDETSMAVLDNAFASLGMALAPSIRRFETTVMVVGGSMSRSWDIVEPALRLGIRQADPELATLRILRAEHPDDAAFIGAAYGVRHRSSGVDA